jgi:hypothetical protein
MVDCIYPQFGGVFSTIKVRTMSHKNWAEISKIEDLRLRVAIGLIDLESADGKLLTTSGLPWFSDQPEEQVRYPLSVVVELAKRNWDKAESNARGYNPHWSRLDIYVAQELQIPIICLGRYNTKPQKYGHIPLPKDHPDYENIRFKTYAYDLVNGVEVTYEGCVYVLMGLECHVNPAPNFDEVYTFMTLQKYVDITR